jgi:hypothetical protein
MAAFRELLSFWNEGGMIVSLLLSIGYFGSRNALAFLPGAFLALFVAGGLGLAIMMAVSHSQPKDEYAQRGGWGDRALWYGVLFLCGTAAVTFVGSLL